MPDIQPPVADNRMRPALALAPLRDIERADHLIAARRRPHNPHHRILAQRVQQPDLFRRFSLVPLCPYAPVPYGLGLSLSPPI